MTSIPPTRSSISRRLLLSLGVLGTVGAVAGLGTYAQFADSTSADHSISTGTVDITLSDAGSTGFSLDATDLAAGDTVQRTVDLAIGGGIAVSGIDFASAATTSSALDTDGTNGLQLQIDRCSQPWTEAGSSPGFTYSCGGTTSSVLAAGAVIRSTSALSNMLVGSGQTNHLRLLWTLPSAADQATFGGVSSTIDYTFSGNQRAATDR